MAGSLAFGADGTFTIVQFTDLHWHSGELQDQPTRALMERVLDAEQPDLVVLTGDVIAGSHCTDPARSWAEAVEAIVDRGLCWAAVLGNHDDEGGLSRAELVAAQQALPGCLTAAGPAGIAGATNYRLELLDSRAGRPAAHLWFVDTLGYAPEPVGGYAWVAHSQVSWFCREAARLRAAHGACPALVFTHTPLPEFEEVQRSGEYLGHCLEPVCCPRVNSGLFCALVEVGGVLGVFAGHDHINDFCGHLHGVGLLYGRASGYATYGREGFARGARVIRLREGQHRLETWLRLDDGARVEQVRVLPTERSSRTTTGRSAT